MEPQSWRELTIVRSLGGVFSVWAILFAFDIFRIGDIVTSKQWQYLMSIPGGRTVWFVLFLMSGLALGIGVIAEKYRLAAYGFLGMGITSLGISVFYYFARFWDEGLLTLGHWIWLIGALMMLFGFAVNWTDKKW